MLSPKNTVAIQKCGKNSENIPLKGTYLLEINNYCEIIIKDILIRNFENPKRNFKNIILPKINFEHPVYKPSVNFKPLKLDDVNLNEINVVKNNLEVNKQKIDSIQNKSIDFNRVSGWTILIYIIIILISMYVLYKFYSRRCQKKRNQDENQPKGVFSEPLQNSDINPRILH